jgi:hypothetical protein
MEHVFWKDDEGLQDWQKEILERENIKNNGEHNGAVSKDSKRKTTQSVSKQATEKGLGC